MLSPGIWGIIKAIYKEGTRSSGHETMAYTILKPERSRPIRGLLFDMDGLVLDSECLYTRFWQEAAQQLGYPMTRQQALGMRSLDHVLGQRYLEQCFGPGICHEEVRQLRVWLMDAWIDQHGVAPKPGILPLLDYLRDRHLPCAITTSSPPDRVKAHLTPLGLYDRFDRLCSGCQVAHGKPEPDIYLFGAAQLGLDPADCLALEDSPAGIEAAYRAGCLPVVIPDQDQPGPETLARCFARADTLADLCPLLDQLNP